MKKIIVCLLFLLISVLSLKKVSAASTNKAELPYEIQQITTTNQGFMINGWAMLSKLQHFKDASTHTYELVLTSDHESLHYTSSPLRSDQTDTMRVFNTPRCNENDFYEDAAVCYYDYHNVGFSFLIPFEDLKESHYDVTLLVHALTTGVTKQTSIFYPTHVPLIHESEGKTYKASSALEDTAIKVVYDDVLERLNPNKYSEVRSSNQYCGSMYGYSVYFAKNSFYQHVYDRISADDTTYYKVGTSAATFCAKNQNQTQEGSDFYSWIPGNFVDYIGTPLAIEVIENTPPEIIILGNPIISVDQAFDPFEWAIAQDKEDGDLSDQLQIIDGQIKNEPGIYELTFYVEDSQKAFDIAILTVEVIDENTPPMISAADKVIYQYTEFDYYEDVSAYDFEDGIVSILWYEGEVNVEELGIYYVTYYCIDSEGLITSKTISVEVIRNPKEKIRYIDAIYPFYEEEIPRNWIYKYPYLFEQLETPRIYSESSFEM